MVAWMISSELGALTPAFWNRFALEIPGEYTPVDEATGIATVTAVEW